jgi:hypothetical protein
MRKGKHSVPVAIMLNLGGMIILLSGCHVGAGLNNAHLENSRFMNSWTTYTHCLNSMDLDVTQFDAAKLRELNKNVTAKNNWDIPLAKQITGLISQPTDRFAVDVNAMTASCTLHSGKTAVAGGYHDVAREIFHRLIHDHPHSTYSYYTLQARAHLTKLDTELQATLQ